jgi:hypothetical protein
LPEPERIFFEKNWHTKIRNGLFSWTVRILKSGTVTERKILKYGTIYSRNSKILKSGTVSERKILKYGTIYCRNSFFCLILFYFFPVVPNNNNIKKQI